MPPDFETLGSIPHAMLGVGLLFAAAYGLGGMLVRRREDHWLLSIAVGLNLVAALGVVLGMGGVLGSSRSVWLLIILAAFSAVRAWRTRPDNSPTQHSPTHQLGPKILLAILATFTLGPALCYPTGWDELVYHHELPKRWLADGWPAFYTDIAYSGFPSLGEILCWLVSPIEHVIAPRLIIWVCWILGILAVYRLLRHRLSAYPAGALTAALALSGAVLMISANCYVESILLLNMATLLLVLHSRPRNASEGNFYRTATLVGVLAGGAAAVKLTGLAVAIVPCIWCICEFTRRKDAKQVVPFLGCYLLVMGAVGLPFYLRPWLLTGNPLYPYYAQWFSTDPARLEMSQYHHALGAAFGVRTFSAFFTGPLLLSANADLYDGTFGWQFVGLLFLAVLAVGWTLRRPGLRSLVIRDVAIAFWLYVFWYLTAQQARFAIPAAMGLLQLAAIGLHRFRGNRRIAVLALILLATLVSLPWRNTGHYLGSWLTALGAVRRADYVNTSTDGVYLPLVKALAEHTPPDAKLAVLFEHRGLYFPRRFEIATPFFQESGFTPPENFADPDSLMQRLRERQFTHVVITNAPAGPDQVPGWFNRFEHFLPMFGQCTRHGQLRITWQSDRYVLLEVMH